MYKLTKNPKFKNLFKRHCNDCKLAIKNFNRKELEQLCKSKNTKPFFNFINKKIGRQKQKTEIKDLKTKEILKDNETAGLFANFFKSVYSNDNGKVPILQNVNTQINDDIIFTSDSIEQTLNKLPNK